jgi:hypothetical protein
MPQYYFLTPFIGNPITFIKIEDINQFYPSWFGEDYQPHHTYRRSHEYTYQIVATYLNNKKKKDKVWYSKWKEYFEGDYELYHLESGKEYRIDLNRS